MKTLYLDIFSGISGDMLIGALIDLGVSEHQIKYKVAELGVDGYRINVARKEKSGIAGVKFDVELELEHAHEHSHEHPAGPVEYIRLGVLAVVILASLTGWWKEFMDRDWLALAATIVGGVPIFTEAWENLRKRRKKLLKKSNKRWRKS